MEQIIIHVDMDAFYASVEIRDNPALRGLPLVIGSLPHERGVVATCSYEARTYGVRSGMNIKDAYRLCPQGIFMHPDFDKYKAVSEQLNAIWNTYATTSQRISLDEAYLDVTRQAGDWEGARRIGHLIKQRTLDEVHLTCSVGVSLYNLADRDEGQTVMRDMLENTEQQDAERQALLDHLQRRYGLDFAGHLEQIHRMETMHKTIEYMRRHFRL